MTPLSPEEVNNLSPTALNELVARKLGWRIVDESDPYPRPMPDYSRSIGAAWTIVDKLGPYFVIGKDGNEWVVVDGWNDDYSEERARADTAPMAICLSFLKL